MSTDFETMREMAEYKIHLSHCYQGEYKDSCKYGDEDCPAKLNIEVEDRVVEALKDVSLCKGCWTMTKTKEDSKCPRCNSIKKDD